MKFKHAAIFIAACAPVTAANAQITQVGYATLTGAQLVTFDDIAGGGAPGTNYDSVFVSNGVSFGERFMGQTLSAIGDNDQLGGAPSGGALTLIAGAPGQNLNVFTNGGSQVLTGLGPAGFPAFNAIGEGAFALTFSSDQSQFGFQLVGGNNGNANISFFRVDGSLIQTIVVPNLADAFYGFSRDGGVFDIRGISLWNDDLAGIGFDNLRHDVRSVGGGIPEPATWAMMIGGFAVAGASLRRRRSTARVVTA